MSEIPFKFFHRRSKISGYLPDVNTIKEGEIYIQQADQILYFKNDLGLLTGIPVNAKINSSDFVQTGSTGIFVTNTETGIFITTGQTGNFLNKTQTGSFITTSMTGSFGGSGSLDGSLYVLTGETGQFVSTGKTGQFITTGKTGLFFVGINQTGQFVSTSQTGTLNSVFVGTGRTGSLINVFVGTGQTGQFITTGQTGQFVGTGQTGRFVGIGQTGQFVGTGQTGNFLTTASTFTSNLSKVITCTNLLSTAVNYTLDNTHVNSIIRYDGFALTSTGIFTLPHDFITGASILIVQVSNGQATWSGAGGPSSTKVLVNGLKTRTSACASMVSFTYLHTGNAGVSEWIAAGDII